MESIYFGFSIIWELTQLLFLITINFSVDASGHPFYLKTVAGTGTGNLISGITNNGTENATITWTADNRGTYYYQCSLHGGMVGTITIQ